VALDPFKGSKWNHDTKIDKRQHRSDIVGWRTSSRPNHEVKRANEDARRAVRKDKRADRRAAAAAEKSSLCASILIASSIAAAGLAANVARAKGWVA
jgi:hypothetical protein